VRHAEEERDTRLMEPNSISVILNQSKMLNDPEGIQHFKEELKAIVGLPLTQIRASTLGTGSERSTLYL
jgi:hypothetical protein